MQILTSAELLSINCVILDPAVARQGAPKASVVTVSHHSIQIYFSLGCTTGFSFCTSPDFWLISRSDASDRVEEASSGESENLFREISIESVRIVKVVDVLDQA